MNQFDLKTVPQEELVSFYGLLFSAGNSDKELDKEDLSAIYELIDLDLLDYQHKEIVKDFILKPPDTDICLKTLSNGTEELKFSVLVGIVEVALADDVIVDEEMLFLNRVCHELNITQEQLEAIINFIKEGKRIQREGLDNNAAELALKSAASGLTAVGVPIAAVYFSGTVIGLSAAGITSGLATLGLGLGMVPGIGVAILIGTGIFVSLKALFGDSKKKKEKIIRGENERKSQLVIKNLHEAINKIISKIEELQVKALQSDANENAINELKERLLKLKKIVLQKQGIAYVQ
ncbi:MAG: TerB family tellurite resistance protein [Bacteroidetes bacterium]|nr:MAG: TerB family tellurite resistance protein [Bacteroidota bacterium]